MQGIVPAEGALGRISIEHLNNEFLLTNNIRKEQLIV